jgi:hypothetical protein
LSAQDAQDRLGKVLTAFDGLIAEDYAQHNPRRATAERRRRRSSKRRDESPSRFTGSSPRAIWSPSTRNYRTWKMAGVDVFRFNDKGEFIEHWDVP